jgi:hypothetical protein
VQLEVGGCIVKFQTAQCVVAASCSKVSEKKVPAVKLFTVLKLWGKIITLAS